MNAVIDNINNTIKNSGNDNVVGYYICRNGKNYAIYLYVSGKDQGLVATVVELSKKQMEKFGLW